MEDKKECGKVETVINSIDKAKKDDKVIKAKKAAIKKKVAEKRKATSELRKAVTTTRVVVMASETPSTLLNKPALN